MKNLYIYLISTGAYSGYGIDCLAVSEKQWSKQELKELQNNVTNTYKSLDLPVKAENVHRDRVEKIIIDTLIANGFTIIYPAGEFHYDDCGCQEDVDFDTLTHSPNESSALRIGLA